MSKTETIQVGEVLYLEYVKGKAYPYLYIRRDNLPAWKSIGAFSITEPDLIDKINRTLVSGDRVEVSLLPGSTGISISRFRIIKHDDTKENLDVRHRGPDPEDVDWNQLSPDDVMYMANQEGALESGEHVYSMQWDAGAQGHNGVCSIVRLGNVYIGIDDNGNLGPYSSLNEALNDTEFNYINENVTSIMSTELDSKTISKLLKPAQLPTDFKLLINDEDWYLSEDCSFVRK